MNPKLKLIIAAALLISCSDRDKHGNILDTPTSGMITVAVDESLKPLIDAEVAAFEGLYQNADIEVIYTNEEEAMASLLRDSARLAIVTRTLIPSEEMAMADQKIVPHQLTMAKDGVALIVNRQNPDTTIRLDELRDILTGKLTRLKKNGSRGLELVFDQPNSGIIRFLRDSVIRFDSLPEYCYALNRNDAVVDYVSKNPGAIGLIDVSWISDHDDSTANSFLGSVRVVAIARDSVFYQPYQAFIAQRNYPLLRDVVMISREARAGLASGFMAFIASDKGQRIVLTSGLVPATMPIRIVEINHEPL